MAQGDTVIAATPRAFSFEVPEDFLLVFVIEKLLETLPPADRAAALQSAMQSAGVSIEAMVVMFLGAQHGRHGEQASLPEERTIPSEADLQMLEEGARERILKASGDGSLWTAARFPRLLFDWKRLGGDVQMRDAVREWCTNDANLIKLVNSLKGPSAHGRESIDINALSALVDLDDAVERARKLLRAPTTEPAARTVLRLLVEAFNSTASARGEQQTRSRLLSGVLQETNRTGSYPTMHWVVTTFEADRPVIDRLVEEKILQQVLDAKCMVTLDGLQQVRANPFAARELQACSALLRQLQAAYRRDAKSKIDLEQLAAQGTDAGTDVNALRRAALALLVHLGGIPRIQLEFGAEGGLPSAASPGDGILDVSLDAAATTDG